MGAAYDKRVSEMKWHFRRCMAFEMLVQQRGRLKEKMKRKGQLSD